jgi:hypothetical protein
MIRTASRYSNGSGSRLEIRRVAVLMVNRYADEAEANSFLRAEELAAKAITLGRRSGVEPRSPLSSLSTRRDR